MLTTGEKTYFYLVKKESKEAESNQHYLKHSHEEKMMFGGLFHLNNHWRKLLISNNINN